MRHLRCWVPLLLALGLAGACNDELTPLEDASGDDDDDATASDDDDDVTASDDDDDDVTASDDDDDATASDDDDDATAGDDDDDVTASDDDDDDSEHTPNTDGDLPPHVLIPDDWVRIGCPEGSILATGIVDEDGDGELWVVQSERVQDTGSISVPAPGIYQIYDLAIAESGPTQTNESGYIRIQNSLNPEGLPLAGNCGGDFVVTDTDNAGTPPEGTTVFMGTFPLIAGDNTLSLHHYCELFRAGECPELHIGDPAVHSGCSSTGANSIHLTIGALCLYLVAESFQCGDGLDNDGDGRTDLGDRGCGTALDGDESDDPPRPQVECYRAPEGMAVDGDLSDYGSEGFVTLAADAWRVLTEDLGGAADLTVRLASRHDDGALYFGVEVTDDVHENALPADLLWAGDSVQLAFDVAQNGGPAYDEVDDHELTMALSDGASLVYRQHGPAGASDAFTVVVSRAPGVTTYEIAVPASALPSASLEAEVVMGFAFMVNDADGAGRVGFMEWASGVGFAKVPELFGSLVLRSASPPLGSGADAD